MRIAAAVTIVLLLAQCAEAPDDPSRESTSETESSTEVSSPARCEEGPFLTSSGIRLPRVLERVDPDTARCIGQKSTRSFLLEAVIDRNGRAQNIRVISGESSCVADAAAAALAQWKFCSAKKDGEAIEMTMTFSERAFTRGR